jgi:acetyl esterase
MMLPELQAFLDDWAQAWAPLAPGASPAERRAHFEQVARQMRAPTPQGVSDMEMWAEHAEHLGRRVRLRRFRHEAGVAASTGRPALIYMHGGAWMQGSPETHWDITAAIAAHTGRVVYSVDYALAPEQPFPAAVLDVQAVVQWLCEQADAEGLDRQAIAIGGDSAGGNLAASATLHFRGSSCALQGQLLIYPGVDFRTDRYSHRENANGPIVSVASMPFVNANYCPNPADRMNPLAAPLLAPRHDGLPPAFVAVAQHDPLRDEGIAYAKALQAAGVATHLDPGDGLIHGYLRAMAYSPAVRERFAQMCRWLQWLPPARAA